MKKNIEAVTVCVNYHDFLQETAKFNAGLFDRWIIVTTPDDEATREVCRRYNLECIVTSEGTRKGFDKGRMIERGLQHTSASGWRLHLDADIAVPHRFHALLDAAELEEKTLYGVDRIMIRSWEEWKRLQATNFMQGAQHDYHCRVNIPHGFTIGTRWAHPQMGYVPIGFFQLWHSTEDEWRGVRVRPYPMKHSTACRTDVQFGLKFDRAKRSLIPEVIVAHLESEACEKGKNWNGRQTKYFGEVASDVKKK